MNPWTISDLADSRVRELRMLAGPRRIRARRAGREPTPAKNRQDKA